MVSNTQQKSIQSGSFLGVGENQSAIEASQNFIRRECWNPNPESHDIAMHKTIGQPKNKSGNLTDSISSFTLGILRCPEVRKLIVMPIRPRIGSL